jgi:hypothetical protein
LVYSCRNAVEDVVRTEVATWCRGAARGGGRELQPPSRALVWVIEAGQVVDAFDIKRFCRSNPGEPATLDVEGFHGRLPPLRGKPLEPGQSTDVRVDRFLLCTFADADAAWAPDSRLADPDGTLMYGANDLEGDNRYPTLPRDRYDPANSGVQSFLLACLRRAAPQGYFEDNEQFVEVLFSAPEDPCKEAQLQDAGFLLCRDPDDSQGFAAFTREGTSWTWKRGPLAAVLATLPPGLADAARLTLDEGQAPPDVRRWAEIRADGSRRG